MPERRRAPAGLAAAVAVVLAASMLSLAPTKPAEAQTTVTLVSNIG